MGLFDEYKDHPFFEEGNRRQKEFIRENRLKKRARRLQNRVKSKRKRKRIYAEWDH